MQCFFVEFRCELGKAYAVAEELANREIASEVYSVSGPFDLLTSSPRTSIRSAASSAPRRH